MRKTLDIVIPVYNEADCIDELFKRLLMLRTRMQNELEVSFIFVNDGSSDKSAEMLEEYSRRYPFARLINFSRNFGHEIAVIAGLDNSNADYTAIIDADLQDPPEVIEEMYKKIKEGWQIAYGKRTKRKAESFFKKFTAFAFYRLLNSLCSAEFPTDTGNFRLITADVRNAITSLREHKRFFRGMSVWVGFKSVPVYYDREGRFAGQTHYTLKSMIKLALNGIYEMSTAPITLINLLGTILFLASLVLLITKNYIIGSIGFVGSLQIFVIGIIGSYITRIYEESRNRPLYIIDKKFNF